MNEIMFKSTLVLHSYPLLVKELVMSGFKNLMNNIEKTYSISWITIMKIGDILLFIINIQICSQFHIFLSSIYINVVEKNDKYVWEKLSKNQLN